MGSLSPEERKRRSLRMIAYHESRRATAVHVETTPCVTCGAPTKLCLRHRKGAPAFCSRACFTEEQRKRAASVVPRLAVCPACGKAFPAGHGSRKKKKFCSKACYRKGNSEDRNCERCGKPIHVPLWMVKKGQGRFCSRACAATRTPVASFVCKECGGRFSAPETRVPRPQFCSRACNTAFLRRGSVRIVCPTCGKDFFSSPRAVSQGRARFCSRQCFHRSKIPTHLETVGNALLALLRRDVVLQPRIGKWNVDAFVPSINLAVEWDGDYWHGNYVDPSLLNKKQRDCREKDARKDADLSARGLRVLHFTETEVLSFPGHVVARLGLNFR